MTGVKSFRIDDLLVENNKLEEKAEDYRVKCDKLKTEWASKDISGQRGVENEKYARSTSPKELESKKIKEEWNESSGASSRLNEVRDLEANSNGSSRMLLPYGGIPVILPVGPISSSPRDFNNADVGSSSSYANVLAYQLNHGRHSGLDWQHGHFPPGMEWSSYQSYIGHFGIPMSFNVGDTFQDKRYFMNERIHYPLYPLARTMYTPNCKRKGGQIRFNNSQTSQLEKAFVQHKYLNANDRKKLAQSLGLSDRQVKTWFQNRRAKLRKCKGSALIDNKTSGEPQYENTRYESSSDSKDDD